MNVVFAGKDVGDIKDVVTDARQRRENVKYRRIGEEVVGIMNTVDGRGEFCPDTLKDTNL